MNNEKTSKPVALVTGGSRGIGFGCAEHLAKAGFDLVINGMRPEESVADALKALQDLGARTAYARGDIGSKESRAGILAVVRKSFGKLNVLVNNAGVAPKERLDIRNFEQTQRKFDWYHDKREQQQVATLSPKERAKTQQRLSAVTGSASRGKGLVYYS